MGKFNAFLLNTSLHGFKYLADEGESLWRKLFRRIFWSGFILLSITLMCTELSSSLSQFNSKATSINLDVNYRDWNNTFPAVSVCLMKGRSTEGIRDYMLNYWNATNIATPNRPIRHYRNIQNLLFMTSHQPLDGIDVDRCLELNTTCGVDVEIVKRELFPKTCKVFMSLVKFLGQEVDCEEIFKPHRSEVGECFTANSLYSNGKYLDNFDQLQLKFSNHDDLERSLEIHYSDSELVIYKIFIHSPDELPDGATEGFILRKAGSHTYMAVRIVEIFNQEGVKNESSTNRQCRFPDEFITDISRYKLPYSLANCRASARIMQEVMNCNCTLPIGFGPKYLPDSLCNTKQFKCIQDSFEAFLESTEKRVEYCSMPTCLAMEIGLVGEVDTTIDEKKGVIIIDIFNKPSLRYLRRVVITKLDFLGN